MNDLSINVNDFNDFINFIMNDLSPRMTPEWEKFLPLKLRTVHLNLSLDLKVNVRILSLIVVSWSLLVEWLPFMMGNFLHFQIHSFIRPSQWKKLVTILMPSLKFQRWIIMVFVEKRFLDTFGDNFFFDEKTLLVLVLSLFIINYSIKNSLINCQLF